MGSSFRHAFVQYADFRFAGLSPGAALTRRISRTCSTGQLSSLASLPMQGMQTALTDLTNQESTLAGLNAHFSALQTALQAIGNATKGSATAQASDPSAIGAAAASGALNGTYSIQVDSVGSSTIALSNSGLTTVTDPQHGSNISSLQQHLR